MAVVVAGTLAVLLVLGVAGAAAFALARGVTHQGQDRVSEAREGWRDGMGPGQRGLRQGGPQRGMGGLGNGPGDNGGGLGGNGKGPGSLLGGGAALGTVQHGEFTVTGSDGKPTVMTLQRGAVTKAGSTTLTVRSDDGFTATYALDSTTRTPGRSVTTGDVVLVVAQKQGGKAVLVRVTR